MVKDGEDWLRLQKIISKDLGWTFQDTQTMHREALFLTDSLR